MKKKALSEAEIAAKVVEFLKERGHEVYQEVRPGGVGTPIADIVYTCATGTYIVETKRRLSMELLIQCRRWQHDRRANGVYAAFQSPARRADREKTDEAIEALRQLGIGSIVLDGRSGKVLMSATCERVVDLYKPISGFLREEHKDWAKAGTTGDGYFTPFRGTCQAATTCIEEHGEMTLKELFQRIDHHYASKSSAYSSFGKALREGLVKGLTLDESKATGSKALVMATDPA